MKAKDQSGPPTLIHGPYVPLSTSIPVHTSTQDESSFQQVIPNILQQLLYPSLVAMGSSPNTALSPSIPLTRRVINEIEEHQRTVLDSYAEGMDREINTSPVLSSDKQQVKLKTTSTGNSLWTHTHRITRQYIATGVSRNGRHWHPTG